MKFSESNYLKDTAAPDGKDSGSFEPDRIEVVYRLAKDASGNWTAIYLLT